MLAGVSEQTEGCGIEEVLGGSAASNREGRGGGRQGTASLLRLPQFLFNCLLIYLIMLTTRTTGQAARVLLLKQFIALRLLLLNNSPSLLDLYHIQ